MNFIDQSLRSSTIHASQVNIVALGKRYIGLQH